MTADEFGHVIAERGADRDAGPCRLTRRGAADPAYAMSSSSRPRVSCT